jgi:hypothetical protein
LALGYPAEIARRAVQNPIDIKEKLHINIW